MFALGWLRLHRPAALAGHYRLPTVPEGDEALLEAVGKRRGFLVKGGVVQLDRAAERVVMDLRDGAFGPLTLELPEDMAAASEGTAPGDGAR